MVGQLPLWYCEIVLILETVTLLPQKAFEQIEEAAAAHEPRRSLDPSKHWGVDIYN